MYDLCGICGHDFVEKKGHSLCSNCGDAIKRLLWIAEVAPPRVALAPGEQDGVAREERQNSVSAEAAPGSSLGFWKRFTAGVSSCLPQS